MPPARLLESQSGLGLGVPTHRREHAFGVLDLRVPDPPCVSSTRSQVCHRPERERSVEGDRGRFGPAGLRLKPAKAQRRNPSPYLWWPIMLHLADRDGNAFCGATDGARTFEYERIDCPDCIRMIRQAELQDRRDGSGGG